MKKMFQLILTVMIIASSLPTTVHASGDAAQTTSSVYNNDYYIETVIIETEPGIPALLASTGSQTVTKTKISSVKDANGDTLWYVSITATFTYDGKTAQCTSCSHQADAYASTWSIKSCTSSRSGNSATATAIAVQKGVLGTSHEYTLSVTIQCSPTGEVS